MDMVNLSLIRFEVRGDDKSSEGEDPLFSGRHHKIHKYLREHGTDDLVVVGTNVEDWTDFEPIPADRWLEWWDHSVAPILLENSYGEDPMIEYPPNGADLTDLADQ